MSTNKDFEWPEEESKMQKKIKLLKRTTSKLIWQGWSNDTEGHKKMEAAVLQNIDDVLVEKEKVVKDSFYKEVGEFTRRGLSFSHAMWAVEALNSSMLEGAKKPKNSKEWDRLVELIIIKQKEIAEETKK